MFAFSDQTGVVRSDRNTGFASGALIVIDQGDPGRLFSGGSGLCGCCHIFMRLSVTEWEDSVKGSPYDRLPLLIIRSE